MVVDLPLHDDNANDIDVDMQDVDDPVVRQGLRTPPRLLPQSSTSEGPDIGGSDSSALSSPISSDSEMEDDLAGELARVSKRSPPSSPRHPASGASTKRRRLQSPRKAPSHASSNAVTRRAGAGDDEDMPGVEQISLTSDEPAGTISNIFLYRC